MKVVNAFAYIFSIFAFLTLGSLLLMIALHILSIEDAIAKLQEVYASPWRSIQAGFVGVVFILVGLAFSKMLVKRGRETDALILQTDHGPIVVSVKAMEDTARKVLKRFHLVKDSKLKVIIHGKDVEVKLRLVLWSGGQVPELLTEIQHEMLSRIGKLLSRNSKIEVICDVQRIEDHESEDTDSLSEKVLTA